ncbi:hypothetical protein FPOAC1_003628 [Fusarium poae]|uniref:hypothetical protein n=1 Tax=Fusarium poae TaxID=36050 RepID=UPI001CEB4036|nr:hypothetical protein FPOAC1_003628 [Fusarium poae]KAG8677604.1 hypothetical protein FPOAC1_003628 [Fusarium poae]
MATPIFRRVVHRQLRLFLSPGSTFFTSSGRPDTSDDTTVFPPLTAARATKAIAVEDIHVQHPKSGTISSTLSP